MVSIITHCQVRRLTKCQKSTLYNEKHTRTHTGSLFSHPSNLQFKRPQGDYLYAAPKQFSWLRSAHVYLCACTHRCMHEH